MTTMRVFIDIDGVLADFHGGVRQLFPDLPTDDAWPAGEYSFAKVLGFSANVFWSRIDEGGPAWWAGLEPYPWAFDLVRAAAELGEITLATSPTLSEASHAGKLRWINKHFGAGFRGYAMIACGKQILARPDALLIDDRDGPIDAFAAAGGNAIRFPRPWNEDRAIAADPMPHVLRCLKAAEQLAVSLGGLASDRLLIEDIGRAMGTAGMTFICNLHGGGCGRGGPAKDHDPDCWAYRLWRRCGGIEGREDRR
jgi:hypothetical protein